ncbi:alpha-galactosidase [Microlunatus flavus]|uniref:Alpha-galactosidase n=1 Tax=Microlunatus flavus TaxID=1036181 RepID=A0A1H9ID92_9ACTN|nr:alpha-galactosidase [Microlunatus flavus]SEQ72553.1 alpha-galactosidase [Microlunatus flavus]
MRTATSTYAVGLAPDGAGPVLLDWTDGEPRTWAPVTVNTFVLPVDREPLELAVLGTRQAGSFDLLVDHGDALVGARVEWDAEDVVCVTDGPSTTLTARGRDTTGDLAVELVIMTSTAHDVVIKHASYTNTGDQPLTLPRAFGPGWELPVGPGAHVAHLYGDWSREFTEGSVDLTAGELSLGSRQGITSHAHAPAVRVSSLADPGGPAYGVALAWSGSWRLAIDAPPFATRVRVLGGVDDQAGVVTLGPGERFVTPQTLAVFAPDGADGVRRRWHDFERHVLCRDISPAHRPVVYNSWYATTFAVDVDHQRALADVAAGLGVEVFVVDDGWLWGRDSDRAGLGDWTPDPVKFPDGLGPLTDAVLAHGMRFGIWVEPEAVNPDSDLYRAHPDWVYRAGDRPLVTKRHQLVLDLGRPEVLTWTLGWLRDLLSAHPITYLKWDMNRPVTDGGRPGDPYGRQWAVQHTLAYHAVLRMLREEFPHVTVEACAGGGGRVDLAVLGLTDVVWPSDETGARDRLAIQHGFLTAYGPHVMSSWVTDEPSRLDLEPASLELRFVVAMSGVLGIGADLLAWDEAQRARAAELVALYRDLRATIHTGCVELHGHPRDPLSVVEHGTPDQTVLLVAGRTGRTTSTLRPRTLAPDASYRRRGTDEVRRGAAWAAGLDVGFDLAPDADVVVLDRV